MGINVLGPLTVDGSGRLGPHDRVVLQALTTRRGDPVRADELVDAVWGERPPASAHKNLQSCIVRLRKALGTDAIDTTPGGYRLAIPTDDIDAARFESQVERARDLLAVGQADRVVYQLENALSLWRGRAYTDLPDWPPARREADRLEELRMDAEELLLDAELRRGHARQTLPRTHDMVRSAPLRERRWELLALAQYRTGAQGEALRSIRQLRAVLARELGIDPSPDVIALEQAILRQEPELRQGVEAPPPVATCPWQGLRAYDMAEAERFFGREAEIEAGLAIVADRRLLALVGPSGSGKSSLMRAGIGARLRQRGTGCTTITPGRHPLHSLTALASVGPDDALLVDQAEEVFTLCEDPDETRAFLARLVEEAATRPVVVALRADRMADLTSYAAFSRLIERGLYLVGGLDEAGLRLAVTAPARQAGLILEPGLVDVLVAEVRDDPGALPLLSHALLETWKRREGNTLTVDGYRDSGGIHGAVAQSAEHLYAQVEPRHRDTLRDLVLRLLSPGREGEPVRTRVPRRLVGADPEHDRLIEMLVAARLVTSDDGVLEITHESLARAWPRLRGWLEDDVDGRRILHHLSSAADAWDGLARPDSELYRGVRLTRALDWAASTDTTLTEVERAFLDASRVQAEIEERSAAERAHAQARLIRRLRIVLGGAVVLLVLALVAGGFAAVQSDRANDNTARANAAAEAAQQAALSADARRVGARALLTDDLSLSLLLAAAGARLDDSPEARANLVEVLDRQPLLVRSAQPEGGYLEGMTVSPDGRLIASSDDRNRMHLYDAATSRWVDTFDAGAFPEDQQAWVFGIFSPDSSLLAVMPYTVESAEPVIVLDPGTMERSLNLSPPEREPVFGVDAQFSADGRYLAATVVEDAPAPGQSDLETTARAAVWDLRSPSAPPARLSVGTGYQGMALSPDGRTLYTSWPLTAYDVGSGRRIWRRPGITSLLGLEINPAGTLLALEDHHSVGDALLVRAADGRTMTRLRGHRDDVSPDIRFSADGTLVGTSSRDGRLIIWDTASGRPLERWITSDPWGVGFSPDGGLVYGGGADSMLRTWDRRAEQTYLRRTTVLDDSTSFTDADLSPDGHHVAYRWRDDAGTGWVRFVDTRTGEITSRTRVPTKRATWPMGAWDPDGGRYVAYCDLCANPDTAVLLDAPTGRRTGPARPLVDDGGTILAMAYVDGGRRILVGADDDTTFVVDAESLRRTGNGLRIVGEVLTAIGSGETALAQRRSDDGVSMHWQVVDLTTGKTLVEDDVAVHGYTSVVSPDGATYAIAGDTGEVVTTDLRTGNEVRRSTGVGAEMQSIDYSADGKLLVTATKDGSVNLWDGRTLDLLGTVHPPRDGKVVPASAQFINDSYDVAIASYDGRVYRWDTDLDRAIDFACRMAGRNLTRNEWAQFLPTQPYRSVCPQD